MKRTLTALFTGAFALLVLSQAALAIPAFARKYGANCSQCHVAFPKLNDWGQRFRDNGYQVPGQQGSEKTAFETAIPVAFRTNAGYSLYGTGGQTASGFHIYGLDLLSAGVLHKNISYLFVYTPRIDEPAADYNGPAAGDNPAQLAAIESAAVVFSNIIRDKLNIRIGRFEPGFQLLSSKRLYYILQPYEIYGFAGTHSSFDFSASQIGIEATGRFKPGLKYALGYINGTGANPDNNRWNDVYLALSKTFGRGEGQSAGQRIGVFGYLGWQPTTFVDPIVSPGGDINGKDNRNFYRIGGDISLNWHTFNLQGMGFYAVDDRDFNDLDPALDYKFWGGVVQLDWAGLPNNRLVGSLMFNWVRPPGYDDVHKVDAYSALVRYYLGSWSAVNIAIHAEFTHRVAGTIGPVREDLVTILLDFDF
ncbi:MAG TPA: hypothetical protein P5119_00840 [Candidatus Aminicenantes bacterium]|nr:hypothetical protein [Candidatus Aminicenantes bacterium]HRY63870.1 hypothetical protein [Candidatus Aminicenantes bacterium]HRZ70783.1 hypothetical protein [Candidatus Aminicenantes bacterium]